MEASPQTPSAITAVSDLLHRAEKCGASERGMLAENNPATDKLQRKITDEQNETAIPLHPNVRAGRNRRGCIHFFGLRLRIARPARKACGSRAG